MRASHIIGLLSLAVAVAANGFVPPYQMSDNETKVVIWLEQVRINRQLAIDSNSVKIPQYLRDGIDTYVRSHHEQTELYNNYVASCPDGRLRFPTDDQLIAAGLSEADIRNRQ
ncbi:Uu.00g100880.m01.CDS01 [Anthostomella pinea]|uniref:Uu.00g100880.m01.CDS01 n=1 Tax=Anthostomella pinea TaxID=933095 RepID=A0AAI8VD57_9PEZI|nr:Uu.00g100880.m01.CDS01 [Anthostomella pinea]